MAEPAKSPEVSSKPKSSSSFLSRSFTVQSSGADSKPKINYASLNRALSSHKFYNSMESVLSATNMFKGKVKQLRSLFEPKKPSKETGSINVDSQNSKINNVDSQNLKINRPMRSLCYSSESSIRLPGTEDRIVVYLTSLRGIRRTYEDCYAVMMIFKGFRVWVDERDISMDSAYRRELQSIFGVNKNVGLPQIFIRGKYVGGADVVKSMYETGELARVLEGFPRRTPGLVCGSCGDVRFVPCVNCSGSRKVFDEDDGVLKRCSECNENGLIRCPDCCT